MNVVLVPCILMYITRNTNHQSTWRSNA